MYSSESGRPGYERWETHDTENLHTCKELVKKFHYEICVRKKIKATQMRLLCSSHVFVVV